MATKKDKIEATEAEQEQQEVLAEIDESVEAEAEKPKKKAAKKTSKKSDEAEVSEELTEEVETIEEDIADDADEETSDEKFAKAGKRSKKALTEAEQEAERQAAKAEEPVVEKKPKIVHVPNPKRRHGKAYRAAAEKIDNEVRYPLADAVALAKSTSRGKFDASLELHVNLGVDPRQADQMVRASVTLPNGTGKTQRIAVLANEAKQAEAKKAGADVVGGDELIAKIDKGQLDFEKLIATPEFMPKLGKLAKVLGPKGLMPNPKSGSVTEDVATAVSEAKAGKVEFRIDKQAIVHQAFGKVSFDEAKLVENVKTLVQAIMDAKPAAAKGTYVKAMAVTSSMGPGVKIDVTEAIKSSNTK